MPKLYPFRAIRYIGRDLSTKIAPPYDVLDEGPKRELLSRDPYNIVAIDLPVTPPKTVGPDSAYESAGATFRRWLTEGVLAKDATPGLFAYEQAFVHEELGPIARRGLFATLGVEEFNRPGGGIFRHEHTIKGGTDDRLKLMGATAAQLSPVFGVYQDPSGETRRLFEGAFAGRPDAVGVTAHDGVEHRLWALRDPQTIRRLAAAFETTDVFIADGHHRYTTALNYHRAQPQNPAAATCLFVLVAAEDPGLRVWATHRVLCGMKGFDFEELPDVVRGDARLELTPVPGFTVEQAPALLQSISARPRFAVGLFVPWSTTAYILSAKEDDPLGDLLPEQPAVWRTLDVAILHELVIDRLLRPRFGGAAITYRYHAAVDEVAASCAETRGLGVVMRPTPLRSVIEVSRAGGVMPPKSTFFYPKLATGLVINPLDAQGV